MKESKLFLRIKYLIATILFLCMEVFIALFVHDAFIRPYLGDVLVVIVIYAFIRIFLPEKYPFLSLWVFVFAAFVEVLQLFQIVNILGLADNRFLSIVIGSVFDIKDILCYGVGCVLLGIYEYAIRQR